jgi:hypothetical protein
MSCIAAEPGLVFLHDVLPRKEVSMADDKRTVEQFKLTALNHGAG